MHKTHRFAIVAALIAPSTVLPHSIALGGGHGVAICADSSVMTWGWNLSGQLGNGYPTLTGDCQCFTYGAPVQYLDSVVQVTAGDFHTVVLRGDGTVREWGFGGSGALGYGFIPGNTCQCAALPVSPIDLPPLRKIAAGRDHTLGIALDSTVWAWGNNGHGQLGDGIGFAVLAPIHIANLDHVVAIGAGDEHSLAVKSDGTVWAWGDNSHGQLGDTTHTMRLSPVQVYGLTDVVAAEGGDKHSVALKSDGTVWAWGWNNFDQLQNDVAVDTAMAVQVQGISDVRAIASGWYHVVALKLDSTVWSWGNGYEGEMGDGSNEVIVHEPRQATGLTGVVEIAAQRNSTLAVRGDGAVRGWGYNYFGQLCDQTRIDKNAPTHTFNVCPAAIALATDQRTEQDRLRIAPNPFTDHFSVPVTGVMRFRLLSLTGEVVLSGTTTRGDIEASHLSGGCYLLEVSSSQGIARTRIVKY